MKPTRQLTTQPRRDAWLEINLATLEHNVRWLRSTIPAHQEIMAIVKADAYGHGAVMVIPTLEASGVSMIGVASVDEALQIRQAGIELPILVIGVVPDWAIPMAAEQDIQVTVFAEHHLESIQMVAPRLKRPVKVQVKIDTGMHRIGADLKQALAFIKRCQNQSSIELTGVFSHFAVTESKDITETQILRWEQLLAQLETKPRYFHIANSEGAIYYPKATGNLVRTGIALFGYGHAALKPVMGVKARIMHVQTIEPGEGVSYGYSFHAPDHQSLKIATLPLGYADGVPRSLSNQIEVACRGQRLKQVGTITMDQLMIDVTPLLKDSLLQNDDLLGETVTLIGATDNPEQPITLSHWAAQANTIEYELMCGLRVRLPKTYTR